MMTGANLLLVIGALMVFVAVLRLIYLNARSTSHYSTTRWALTGGTVELLAALALGCWNIVTMRWDANAKSCLVVIGGLLLIWFGIARS